MLLYDYTTILLYSYTAMLLYDYTIILLYYFTTIHTRLDYTTILLYYYTTSSGSSRRCARDWSRRSTPTPRARRWSSRRAWRRRSPAVGWVGSGWVWVGLRGGSGVWGPVVTRHPATPDPNRAAHAQGPVAVRTCVRTLRNRQDVGLEAALWREVRELPVW